MRDWLDAVEIPVDEVDMEGDNIRCHISLAIYNLLYLYGTKK
jgi:hypothetical protein